MRIHKFRFWNFNSDPALGGDVGGGGGEGEGVNPEPSDSSDSSDSPASPWPDNWRDTYAQGDEKKLAHLSRYASPEAAFDGLIATKTKINAGELRSMSPFPTEGTDAEKAAWREQQGVPLEPKGYEFDGIKEEDQQFIESFKEYALDNNVSKDQANVFVEFLKQQDQYAEEQELEMDNNAKQVFEDKMRVEWGTEYRRNINMIQGLLDTAPEEVKGAILNGRAADGTPLGSHIEVMRFLADVALQINPVNTLVPHASGDVASSIGDEIAAIENDMRTNSREYYKDEAKQERYRQLLEARDRMGGRKAS